MGKNEASRCWKIVEHHEAGFKTLFHGVNGSRLLPRGKWLTSERKWCGEGVGRKYWTGFHVVTSRELCEKYFALFKRRDGRGIVECLARGLRKKPGGRPGVMLAKQIMVPA